MGHGLTGQGPEAQVPFKQCFDGSLQTRLGYTPVSMLLHMQHTWMLLQRRAGLRRGWVVFDVERLWYGGCERRVTVPHDYMRAS